MLQGYVGVPLDSLFGCCFYDVNLTSHELQTKTHTKLNSFICPKRNLASYLSHLERKDRNPIPLIIKSP